VNRQSGRADEGKDVGDGEGNAEEGGEGGGNGEEDGGEVEEEEEQEGGNGSWLFFCSIITAGGTLVRSFSGVFTVNLSAPVWALASAE